MKASQKSGCVDWRGRRAVGANQRLRHVFTSSSYRRFLKTEFATCETFLEREGERHRDCVERERPHYLHVIYNYDKSFVYLPWVILFLEPKIFCQTWKQFEFTSSRNLYFMMMNLIHLWHQTGWQRMKTSSSCNFSSQLREKKSSRTQIWVFIPTENITILFTTVFHSFGLDYIRLDWIE